MSLIGKKIYLREMELEDMECYREMINDSAIAHNVVGWSFPVSKMEQKNWYEKNILDKKNLRFSVVLKASDQTVGMVTLSKIDWQNRSATHGIKLHPSCPKGQGIGTDAVMTLMKYAFDEVNLNRLDGGRIEYNLSSKMLYEKCGWSDEGVKKKAIYRDGEYHDFIIMGILKEDYQKVKAKLGY